MRSGKKTKTLAFQIISFIFFFLVIVLAVTFLIIGQLINRVTIDSANESIGNLLSEKVQLIDKKLVRIMTQGRTFRNVVSSDVLDETELRRQLLHLLYDNPDLISVCLAYGEGSGREPRVYQLLEGRLSSKLIANPDYQYKDWYQIPYLTQKSYWSDPWFDADGSAQLVCSYSLPLVVNGSLMGILRLDLPLENLQRIALSIKAKDTGYAFLLSYNGTIVAHPEDSLAMNYTIFDLAEIHQDARLREIGKSIVNDESGIARIKDWDPEGDVWIYYRPLPSSHWTLAMIVPHAELVSDYNKLTLIYLIAAVIAFLIVAAIVYGRTHAINQPLKNLVDSLKLVGRGDLDFELSTSTNAYEIKFLTEAFEQMRASLKEYITNLRQVTAERNRIMNEVLFASAIQRNLIPKHDNPGLRPQNISTYGILEPAGQIGGDLYDYFLIDANHFCFGIADVVGKGIGAAMSMTMVTTLLRTVAPLYGTPAQIMGQLNGFLVKNNLESNFVTMTLGIIDLNTGELVFSNAGHVPLYLLRKDGRLRKFAATHSTALGFFEELAVESESLKLGPGDQIILVTDGVTEALSPDESLFGTAGLETILGELAETQPERTAQAILAAVRDFSRSDDQKDDITILVVEFQGNLPG
ncbi:MAG: SpoIIE family protein phosphatase [Candidatus Syntrophosphaera sp.]|nr:SpoIIE family protein phosphatase [Candidatus Syntrophosphaera sp.]